MAEPQKLWLIAEYCPGPFYMGWWLYLRENKRKNKRNADGGSGIIWNQQDGSHPCTSVFTALGLDGNLRGGTGDDGAIGRFAAAYAMPGSRIAGKPRGAVPVCRDEWGEITLDRWRMRGGPRRGRKKDRCQ